MKIEVRNQKLVCYVQRRALIMALTLAMCVASDAPAAKAAHQFFNNDVETLEFPGPSRFWNTAGIVISPARTVAQVNTEVPMFAGVCDGQGHLLPYEKVEWMTTRDSRTAGTFIDTT
jgi:hypothetical protein